MFYSYSMLYKTIYQQCKCRPEALYVCEISLKIINIFRKKNNYNAGNTLCIITWYSRFYVGI